MKIRTTSEKIFDGVNVVLMVLVAIITLLPFWHVLVTSFLPYGDAIKNNLNILPTRFDLSAYKFVLSNSSIMNGLYISILVTISATLYQLLITTMCAYPLTKRDLPGRNILLPLIIIPMFFSGGLIPYFILIRKLGLVNNIAVLIIPAAISTWNLIIMKEFIKSLGTELEESAKIDGAGYFRILFQFIIPLSKPVLSAITLFIAVSIWNDWFTPILFINKRSLWPLSAVLQDILVNTSSEMRRSFNTLKTNYVSSVQIKDAIIIVSIVPIIIVYPFLQKYFAKGVMIGSIKG